MILGFQDRFVPFVEDGSKTHTIRAGERWKVGMRADLFARPRQKGMRLLFRAQVVKVERIEIHGPEMGIWVDGNHLGWDEVEALAYRDGFRGATVLPSLDHLANRLHRNYPAYAQMMEFWRDRLPFQGQIIHWNYEQRFMVKPGKKPATRRIERALSSGLSKSTFVRGGR